ncbi:MAG: DUF427 domain-containing protein [Candidatus Spechtbacterales bacterium]
MKAIWNNQIIAESDDTVVVESNHYFPAESVKMQYLAKNGDTYTCPWKGVCDYYDVTVDDKTVKSGAFMYPEPKSEAGHIRGHFAFWHGVDVTS